MKNKLINNFGNNPVVWAPLWGVSKLRKRGGKFAGAIDGDTLWYDEWYEKVMSEETVIKLKDIGVNLVVLPFSLGGDEKIEIEERNDFSRMTEICHKYEITSLAYLQYQNYLHEAFSPHETVWTERADGSRAEYNYWRKTPCHSNETFLDYFKKLISDVINRNGDGIWIDNNFLVPCKCRICSQNFRNYLADNCQELLDRLFINDFKKVEIPYALGNTMDPIIQAYIEFNCEKNLIIQKSLKQYLESIAPDALFCSNPALYRGDSHFNRGVDLKSLIELNDFIYLENKLFPEEQSDQVIGNYHGFISAKSCGTTGVAGAWKKPDFESGTFNKNNPGMVANGIEAEKCIYEAVTFNGAIGLVWAIRSMPRNICTSEEDLMKMYFEWDEIYQSTRNTIEFLKQVPLFGNIVNVANVAVLYHKECLKLNFNESWPAVHALEELLLLNSIPYNVLFSEKLEDLYRYKLLILPGISILSDAESELIQDYVKKGGNLLVLGNIGLYNEKRLMRKDFSLKDVIGASSFDKFRNIIMNEYYSGKTGYCPGSDCTGIKLEGMMKNHDKMIYPAWINQKQEVIAAINELLGNNKQLSLECSIGRNIAATISRTHNGRTAIQFFSYSDNTDEIEITVKIGKMLFTSGSCEWHLPQQNTKIIFEKDKIKSVDNYRIFNNYLVNYGLLLV